MSHVFDINTTRRQQILVEYMTPAGSGFAVTPQGEQVFMNKRLIDAMNVKEGDIYDAYLLPNYPDKQEQIPWRAMRVEPVPFEDTPACIKKMKVQPTQRGAARRDIAFAIKEGGRNYPYTVENLAEETGLHPEDVAYELENCPEYFVKVDAYMLIADPK